MTWEKPEACPRNCGADGGWDYRDPNDVRRCDHGEMDRKLAELEEADRRAAAVAAERTRVLAARRARATGEPT